MINWKIAFWCCFVLLIVMSGFSLYTIIDQAVTLTYHKEDYKDTKNDLNKIIDIVNNTDLTKTQIESELRNHNLYEFINFKSDTIALYKVLFIFEKDTLISVKKI